MNKKHNIKKMIKTCLALIFIWAGLENAVLSQEDLSLIFDSQAHKFLNESMCSKQQVKTQYMDFIGQRIPALIVPSSKNKWKERSEDLRKKLFSEVFLKNVPKAWKDEQLKVEWFDIIDKGDYLIRKLRYECLPSLFIPALLYVPKNLNEKVPIVLNVNGHVGKEGKAVKYKQIRCINEAKRGMIALNIDWVGHGELYLPGYMDHNNLAYLDLCGVSGVSVFYLTLKKGLDLLLQQEHADSERVAVTGLSGGGWQTIVISSLDTRVSCIVPVAGYIGLLHRLAYNSDIGDLEQNPSDLCRYADYTHLTALLAPKPTLLINNKYDDCCFKAYRARSSIYSPVIPFYSLYNKKENFLFYENIEPGTHNYEKNNREQFYKFLDNKFFDNNNAIDREIPVENEILSEKETIVGVPKNNQTFNSLALSLMSSLPLNNFPNGDKEEILSWQESSREKLEDIIRFNPVSQIVRKYYKTLQLKNIGGENNPQLSLSRIKYFINKHGLYKEWEIPAVKITTNNSNPDKIAIIISDKGREDEIPEIKKYLASNYTIIALDILLTGEQRPHFNRPWFGAMLLANVGERSMGIAVAQLNAIADLDKDKKVTLIGKGMVSSTIALLTASLKQSDNIKTIDLIGLPFSLKLLIKDKIKFEKYPELYCFGLLRYFDIKEYIGMAFPTNVHISEIMGRREKVKKEFQQLKHLFQKNDVELIFN